MWRVPVSEVTAWKQFSEGNSRVAYPSAWTVVCPHCQHKYGFQAPEKINRQVALFGQPMSIVCPGCRKKARFLILDPSDAKGEGWTGELWMHPKPRYRQPLPVEGIFSTSLAADYRDALRSFEHGLWRPAAQSARVVLEGVVRSLLGTNDLDSRATLHGRLKELSAHVDLAQPVNDVGDVLRDGGNLASHFEEGRSVSPQLAEEMLDLLDAFIEYLILLPQRVESLKQHLEDPGT